MAWVRQRCHEAPGSDRRDGVLQALMGVGDDQGHPAEPTGHQAAEKGRPARPVLGGEDVEAQISRCPSALTPVAMTVATETTRPPSLTLWRGRPPQGHRWSCMHPPSQKEHPMLSKEKQMDVLEACDLTKSLRAAAELTGIDHDTVAR